MNEAIADNQLSLAFDEVGKTVNLAYLEGRMAAAQSEDERQSIREEVGALVPGAIWNGKIWVTGDDVEF